MGENRSVGWLHLTDLHVGLGPAEYLWPNQKAILFEDFKRQHEWSGPWDLLFFTGDLTQRGTPDQFKAFDTNLAEILALLRTLGSEPMVIAVPGNHDLVRPKETSAVLWQAAAWADTQRSPRDLFWKHPKQDLRAAVTKAFRAWSTWWADKVKLFPTGSFVEGILPGDYSLSLSLGGLRVGVVGLNSSFLHLNDASQGSLDLDARQTAKVCSGGTVAWSQQHDVCFLLTHHPPDWLCEFGRDQLYNEINPPQAGFIHIFGHGHEGSHDQFGVGGGQPRTQIMGRSLLGLEWLDDGKTIERAMGYGIGRVWLDGEERKYKLWPRTVKKIARHGGWQVSSDSEHYDLPDDRSTRDINFGPAPDTKVTLSAGPQQQPAGASEVAPASPPGWTRIDRAYLATHRQSLTELRLQRYFDGAPPTWGTAQDSRVPRRAMVGEVIERFKKSQEQHSRTVVLLEGAGGEGKSTVLFQATTDLVENHEFVALWHESGLPMSTEAIVRLPPGKWVLVMDSADQVAQDLFRIHEQLRRSDRQDVHFLLAARDTDWRYVRGHERSWGGELKSFRLSSLSMEDAVKVVVAWRATNSLGKLRAGDTDERNAKALVSATEIKAARREGGTFFGGVLEARFSPEGLLDHVRILLARLGEMRVGAQGQSLRQACLFVAALDGVELDGIDVAVLARLVGVSKDRVWSELIRPLGEEAATTDGGQRVRTRHIDIARSMLRVAHGGDIDDELGEIYAKIVRTVIVHPNEVAGGWHGWLPKVAHIGPRLLRQLPALGIAHEECLTISIRAAQVAATYEKSHRAAQFVTLAHTWRQGGRPDKAASVLRTYAEENPSPDRGLWFEWGVSAGVAGESAASVLLTAYSVSDRLNPLSINLERAKVSLAGIGRAFMEIIGAHPSKSKEFAQGLQAAATLGFMANPDPTTRSYFETHREQAARFGVEGATPEQALAWLTLGVAAAEELVDDEPLLDLLKRGTMTFEALGVVLRSSPIQSSPIRQQDHTRRQRLIEQGLLSESDE